MTEWLSFRMREEFFDGYRELKPGFGFPAGAGNTLGEHAWLTKYSRTKPDGSRERFWEGLRRVTEGMYSIQKDYALQYRLPWNEEQAHRSAQEAYDRAFAGKWSPPGRGLWMMGTELVNGRKDSSALQNCSFLSTADIGVMDDPSFPFVRQMDQNMLGVGVGFDTLGAGKITLHQPSGAFPFQIPDSREGWCNSLGALLRAFFLGRKMPVFDYSLIRPAGSPIRTFGGTAAGPQPLVKLHEKLTELLQGRDGQPLSSRDITDIFNLSGKCVVSANVRRSAEIALGMPHDEDFLSLKDWNNEANRERTGYDGWGHISNNSVIAQTGEDYSYLAKRIALNGEPGLFWLDVAQQHGRLCDPPDGREYRTKGTNPCQPRWSPLLTPQGVCLMGDIEVGDTIWSQDGWVCVTNKKFTGIKPVNRYHTSNGFIDATENHRIVSGGIKVELKDAYTIDSLCGDSSDIIKIESLGEHEVLDITVSGNHHTYWCNGFNVSNCGEQPLENNELCTLVETFPSRHDNLSDYLRTLKFSYLYGKTVTLLMTRWPETNEVMIRNRRIGTSMTGIAQFAEEHGWAELRRWQDRGYEEIRRWDRVYSEWLGVRESIRVTTVKPSGTVSLLWGVTPGVHWPRERGFYVRTVREMKGSPFATAMAEAGYLVEPSVSDPDTTVVITFPVEGPDIRPEREVSIWEKTALAAHAQRYWSDNAVSVTVTFREDEADQIPAVLRAFDGQLKSASFLPSAEGTYAQAPYQRVTKERWDELRARVKPIPWDALYGSELLPEATGELYCSSDTCEVPSVPGRS